ncbi:MAG TPA: PIN domain-containing protein [Propionibacteriaceae bacterium]|nr:PIN domain-containing protein [Propionibacteriaceae bacterium]
MLRVLDSTVLIDYLRGRPAVARIASLRDLGDVPATTALNVEEIVRGLKPTEAAAAGMLFSGLVVLPIERASAWQAGVWRREFASRGTTLSQADCLIAATAAAHGASLATGNPEDFPMPELDVTYWPVGQ